MLGMMRDIMKDKTMRVKTSLAKRPQLATLYKEKMEFPLILEPKLDGMRVLLEKKDGKWIGWSRDLKPVHGLASLNTPPVECFDEGTVLDGEAVCTGEASETIWNETVKALKTHGGRPDIKCDYIVFDFQARVPLKLSTRRELLYTLFEYGLAKHRIPSHVVWEPRSVRDLLKYYLSKGYEGVMLKDPNSFYGSSRTVAWQKIKPIQTADLEVTQWHEGTGQFSGMLGALTAIGRLEDGRVVETKVGTGFTHQQREEWTKEKIVGKIIEVEYQQVTVDNSLRGPAFKRIRTDRELD